MTREEEIKEAAVSFCRVEEAPNGFAFIPQSSFVVGAEWADAHPHWISVEDKLPPLRQGVLAYNGVTMYIAWVSDDFVWRTHKEHCFRMYPVTHWMPLPLPPLVTDLNKKDLPPLSLQEGNILVEEKENDMKATDLMLGDLVIHGFGGAGRITEICQNSVVIKDDGFDLGDGKNEVGFAINELKPIPLTPETLKKNGFELQRDKSELGTLDTYWFGSELGAFRIHRLNNGDYQFGLAKIRNVHELQHALRLCGINKDIEI